MSQEIINTTIKYNKNLKYKPIHIGYCYLNTSTKQYFWLDKPIERTTNVTHLVRMWHLDRIKSE